MEVFLIGGGWSDTHAHDMFGGFVVAAAAHAAPRPPRVLLVVMGVDDEAREYHEKYVRILGRVGVTDLLVERVAEGSVVDASVLEGIDGLFVGGGPMPEYHASLAPAYVQGERRRAAPRDRAAERAGRERRRLGLREPRQQAGARGFRDTSSMARRAAP